MWARVWARADPTGLRDAVREAGCGCRGDIGRYGELVVLRGIAGRLVSECLGGAAGLVAGVLTGAGEEELVKGWRLQIEHLAVLHCGLIRGQGDAA